MQRPLAGPEDVPREAPPDGRRLHHLALAPELRRHVHLLKVERNHHLRIWQQREGLWHRLRDMLLVHAAAKLLR